MGSPLNTLPIALAALLLPAALPVPQDDEGQAAQPEEFSQALPGPGDIGFGSHITLIGDLNGDGLDDVVFGAPQLRPVPMGGAGKLHVVSSDGTTAVFSTAGTTQGEAFGTATVRVGDWDGDGVDDLVVGAPRNDEFAVNGGQLQIRSGRDGSPLGPEPPPPAPGEPPNPLIPIVLSGEEPFGRLGTCLAPLPDMDDDGLSDFAASGSSHPSLADSPGFVFIVSTRDMAVRGELWGDDLGELFGAALVAVPDLDDDDVPELAIGAPGALTKGSAAGRVVIYSPGAGRVLRELKGKDAEQFGSALASAPGMGSDGGPALLVGAPAGDKHGVDAGAVHLIDLQSGKRLRSFDGATAHDQLGGAVAAPGDFDGDGQLDIVAGAVGDDAGGYGAGAVLVWSGSDGKLLHRFDGERAGLHLGAAFGAPGDLDGDGRGDLLVGALGGPSRDAIPGLVRLVPGRAVPEVEDKGRGKRRR